jgi:hypothetical protein
VDSDDTPCSSRVSPATGAIDDDSDGLPRITLRFYLGFGFLFRQQPPQFFDKRNELLGFGLTWPRHLDVRLTTYTRGRRLRPMQFRGEVNFIQCLCGYLYFDDENVTEVQARQGGTVSLAQLAESSGFTRLRSAKLLDIGNFPVEKCYLDVLVNVNLFAAHVEDFFWLSQARLHLISGHS